MEVWILLAAAGSGYLARRWQNAQKPKGTSADEADPDNSACSSSQLQSSRVRYRHFSSNGRRQGGKPFSGKGGHHWGRFSSKNSDNSESLNGTEQERADSDGRKVKNSRDGGTIGDGSKVAPHNRVEDSVETLENVTAGCSKHALRVLEQSTDHCCNHNNTENQTGGFQESDVNKGVPLADAEEKHPTDDQGSLLRSYSGKRANDSLNENSAKGGCLLQDRYSGKRMKDALESMPSQEELFGGTWMPGFWDVSQGVFVLDADSLLVQQEGEGRSKGNSTRKIKTPNKYGRTKGSTSRRKGLTSRKPMSSLESCLSAQLDGEYNQRRTDVLSPPFCSSGRGASDQPLIALGRNLVDHSSGPVDLGKNSTAERDTFPKMDYAIGLPSLSRLPTRRNSLKKLKKVRSFNGKASKGENGCKPSEVNQNAIYPKATQESSAGWVNFGSRNEEDIQRSTRRVQGVTGLSDTPPEGLLFNFGVGVGIMFSVMSNMREVKKLTKLLKEAEMLIKHLEDEIHPATGSEYLQSEDMAKLEAELEAELERMELNLNDGSTSKHQRRDSGESELDAEIIGNLIEGELTVGSLPFEIELESEEDGSNSSHEDFNASNYAVSPRELAKRLHEVLEARQEEQISELEAELKLLSSMLQHKEEELQYWKDRSPSRKPGCDRRSFSNSCQTDNRNSIQSKESSETDWFLSREVEKKLFLGPAKCSSPNVHAGTSDQWEQVDLLSLAEDLYIDGDLDFEDMPTDPGKGQYFTRRKSSRKKGMISSHPGPELSSTGSKAIDSSDDTTNDTSGSTPCSVKFMDVSTVGHCTFDKLRTMTETGGSHSKSILHADWSEESLVHAGANTPIATSQEEKKSLYFDEEASEILACKQGDWNVPDDFDTTSDLDEQLGELLIKRIVEKSRKGSPIIEDAQTVLASFERNETSLSVDWSSEKDIISVESIPPKRDNSLCDDSLPPLAIKKEESTPYFGANETVSHPRSGSLLSVQTVERGFLNSMTRDTRDNVSTAGATSRSSFVEERRFSEASRDLQVDHPCVFTQLLNGCNLLDERDSNSGRQYGSQNQSELNKEIRRNSKPR